MKSNLAGLCLVLCFVLFCGRALAQTITAGPVNGNISACVGTPSASIQQFSVTGSGLTGNITVTAPADFELTADRAVGYNPVHLLVPTGGSVNMTIYVRSSASAPVGGISGKVTLASPGAATLTVAVNGNVSALPKVNPVASQTVAHGDFATAINFSGTGQDYTWTNSDPNIGLPASGRGNIPLFRAINTTGADQKATITVTPVPGNLAYTANGSGNSVSAINTGTRAVQTITVGTQPEKTIVSADGSRVFVSNAGSDFRNIKSSISLIDAYAGQVIKQVEVPYTPQDIKLSPDGRFLYVASTGGNKLTILDAADLTLLGSFNIASNPSKMIISPDGSRLYIASEGPPTGKVTVFNTVTKLVEKVIDNVNSPGGIAITPNGKLLYVTDQYGNKLNVINTTTNTVIAVINVGSFPGDIAIHPDGSKVFVANTTSNNISVISTANHQIINTIAADPFKGMTMSPDGAFIYAVGQQNPPKVSVVSTATNTVTATITLTGAAGSPAISPDGSRLFVPELIGGSVFVINTLTNTIDDNPMAGAGPFVYNNSVSAGLGCTGVPVTFTITVTPPPPPIINHTGTLARQTTEYGTASAYGTFNVSASRLTTGVLVTPPAGFELSTDKVNFTPTLTLGSIGTLASTPVYIRLSATSNASPNYGGDIVLSSGPTRDRLTMPVSIINPAPITLAADGMPKVYGTILTSYTGADRYKQTAGTLKNGNRITQVTQNYGTGSAATDPVNNYRGEVKIDTRTITGDNGFIATNYAITPIPGDIDVRAADITIQATDLDKTYGITLTTRSGATDFKVTGMRNGETIGTVTLTYGTGALGTDPVKLYTGSITPSAPAGGTFKLSNYHITDYLPGNINVVPAVLVVKADNKSRDYRAPDPVFTYSYSGFVNTENEAVLTTKPTLSTPATVNSVWGTYPIIAAGALASNYAISYTNGTLTIIPPITLPGAILSITNTFTPNGDGINDTWNLPALSPYPNCTVKIFDRRGVLIFNSIGYPRAWDGTYRGAYLPSGVYYYVIDPKQDARVLSGSVTIIR